MDNSYNVIYEAAIENPKITIAIPTYKRSDLLKEAIESSCCQEFNEPYEILVSDNNPERGDETENLMNSFRSYTNITYYKNKENIGGRQNWNQLYKLAKGKYVVLLHDDDKLYPYYLMIVNRILKETKGDYQMIYPGIRISSERILEKTEFPSELICRKMRPQDDVVGVLGIVSGMFLEKKCFFEIGGFKADYHPVYDQDFIFRALHHIRGIRVMNLPMLAYYVGTDNASMKPETINKAITQSLLFYQSFTKRLSWPWNLYAQICYRHLMNGLFGYWKQFNEEYVTEVEKSIKKRDSRKRDLLSGYFAKYLRRYLIRVRTTHIDLS